MISMIFHLVLSLCIQYFTFKLIHSSGNSMAKILVEVTCLPLTFSRHPYFSTSLLFSSFRRLMDFWRDNVAGKKLEWPVCTEGHFTRMRSPRSLGGGYVGRAAVLQSIHTVAYNSAWLADTNTSVAACDGSPGKVFAMNMFFKRRLEIWSALLEVL